MAGPLDVGRYVQPLYLICAFRAPEVQGATWFYPSPTQLMELLDEASLALISSSPHSTGPRSNPANLPADGKSTVFALFAHLFRSAISTAGGPHAVKFLSRHDKSAANIAESRIWATIGQTPWADPPSPWYHRYVDFPFQALRAASKLGEYTLVDRGTWWSVEAGVREGMVVFMEGRDEDGSTTEENVMINPAHVLLGREGRDSKGTGEAFVEWMVKREGGGGQRVIEGFERGGEVLYTVAPAEEVDALGAGGEMLGEG